ncbi:MAG: branched-chain amino acid ABC transporter permease [Candidatus Planktophila sp.]|jgi:branched-chain amino acid transport system permease protein|tara:strand:+ start:7448 stop:8356 length:909 start_codon:yes stop_codon:yes gene_type:complete
MFQFINTILIGLTSGAIYSLMALAIVLVWRSTRVINFAQAGLALASTYIGYQVLQVIDNYWLALLIAMIAGAALSAFIELAFMRVLLKHTNSGPIASVAPIIATLGLLGIVKAVITMIWGGQDVLVKPPLSNTGFSIGTQTLVFSPMKLAIIISVALLVLVFSLIFQKTNIGLALRASAYAPEIARLAGVRVDFVRTLGWALSGASGAVAGLLLTSYGNGSFSPESIEFSLLLISGFIAAVIGGLDSLVGAVIGGLVLGLASAFVLMYISGSLFFIAPFVILLLVLFIRPQGILGTKAGRRA